MLWLFYSGKSILLVNKMNLILKNKNKSAKNNPNQKSAKVPIQTLLLFPWKLQSWATPSFPVNLIMRSGDDLISKRAIIHTDKHMDLLEKQAVINEAKKHRFYSDILGEL